MKKIFVLIFIILFKGSILYAQQQKDKVQYHKIVVYKKASKKSHTFKKGVPYGDTPHKILSTFGQPLKKKKEDIKGKGMIYEYPDGITFESANNKINHFLISTPNYYLIVDKNKISIGDDLARLRKYFPLSYQHRRTSDMGIYLIKPNGATEGNFLIFYYNPKTNKISKIGISPYY